jgi:metal-responsive CopG/Arc/MetJ family transcriptional regulator
MGSAKRITISLPEEIVRAVDETSTKRECSRSALVEDALRWYLRVQDLAWDEASPEEIETSRQGARKSTGGSS